MVIYFKNRKLQKVCSNSTEAVKQLGSRMARKLQQRMMELRAADSLSAISKLPPPRCHALTGDRKGQFSIDLDHPYRLLFIPADNPLPHVADGGTGGIDWERVTEIEIIEITDTH